MTTMLRLAALLPVLAIFAACEKPATTAPAAGTTTEVAKKENKHDGWWCDEHALPEEVCDLCSKKYREAEKKKGNWCEHDRVKTSCFKCTPEAREKYAKEYRAKFGKEPPEPEPEEPVKAKEKGKS